MAHDLAYAQTAVKQLGKLDPPVARRLLDHMDQVAGLDDPRLRGKGLTGDRAGLWRYRVGDYRVLCEIDDARVRILALEVGHRSDVHG